MPHFAHFSPSSGKWPIWIFKNNTSWCWSFVLFWCDQWSLIIKEATKDVKRFSLCRATMLFMEAEKVVRVELCKEIQWEVLLWKQIQWEFLLWNWVIVLLYFIWGRERGEPEGNKTLQCHFPSHQQTFSWTWTVVCPHSYTFYNATYFYILAFLWFCLYI